MCASIQIFVIALMVQSGLAIKCFNCDSASNPRCANMTDPSLVAEECNIDRHLEEQRNHKYNNRHRHWLLVSSDFTDRYLKNEFDVKMVCQKLVGIEENKHLTIVRRCQIAHNMPCNFSREHTSKFNREIECHLCDEDGCNGSTNNSVFGMLIGFVAAVAVFKQFVF